MLKIRMWKFVALTIITLGLYQLYWFYKTRQQLVQEYGQSIPPISYIVLSYIAGAVAYLIMVRNNDQAAYMTILSVLVLLIVFAYSMYWTWKYCSSAANVLNDSKVTSVPAGLLFILFIFTDFFGPLFVQYYNNRLPDKA